jgi:hypothetical protein
LAIPGSPRLCPFGPFAHFGPCDPFLVLAAAFKASAFGNLVLRSQANQRLTHEKSAALRERENSSHDVETLRTLRTLIINNSTIMSELGKDLPLWRFLCVAIGRSDDTIRIAWASAYLMELYRALRTFTACFKPYRTLSDLVRICRARFCRTSQCFAGRRSMHSGCT